MSNNKEYHIHIHYTVQEEVFDEDVPVTEELYRAYKQPEWKEARRKERESRCLIPTKTGKLKRCTADCSKCKRLRSGTPYSLERMQEDGMDTPDHNSDVEEAVMYGELLSALMSALDELDPDMRAIADAIMNSERDKDAALHLGYAAVSTYNSRKQKLLDSLRIRLEKYL